MGSEALDPVGAVRGLLPDGLAGAAPHRLCEKLARSHYENFAVASLLLPRKLRRHFRNVYAYCRVCDDLADETGDPALSLRLLDWWRGELRACFDGRPGHPVFQALSDTIREFDLPIQPFEDLISAFEQDQRVTRYVTYEDLLDYCRRSANPVGRLVLALLGYTDEPRQRLSDCTCTALQLANFWQDVGIDYRKGRVYIPQEDMARFGYTEAELSAGIVNTSFRRLMLFEIARTRELFERGQVLQGLIAGAGAADVELFARGGLALLDNIEKNGCEVFSKRITVGRARKARLIAARCLKSVFRITQKR